MANSEVHQAPCMNSYAKENSSGPNFQTYPASVTEISSMLAEARKDSAPDCAALDTLSLRKAQDTPPTPSQTRAVFKKSHTCGSLFAKCGCNNDNSARTPLLQTFSNPSTPFSPQKKSSITLLAEIYPNSDTKRLSNPEISSTKFQIRARHSCEYPRCSITSKPVITSIYNNHPEIPYPIVTVEVPKEQKTYCDNSVPNQRLQEQKTVSFNVDPSFIQNLKHPDLISKNSNKDNLDYLKYTALAYEKQSEKEEQAEKFFKDFGLFGPMGNGATSGRKNSKNSSSDSDIAQNFRKNSKLMCIDTKKGVINGTPEDYHYLKTIVPRLEKELSDLEIGYGSLQTELAQTKRDLSTREEEVNRLQREIHKLKSVLQQTTNVTKDGDILASLQEKHAMANRVPIQQQSLNSSSISKKQGVSAESSDVCSQPGDIAIVKHEKDFRSKQLIKDAILDNDFLKHLDSSQIREIVDCMYLKEFTAGSYVIREGEAGAHLYVSAEGNFEVIKDNNVLGNMGPKKAFGELAILYNCTRTASIRVVVDSKVWVLDRKVFQQIMVRTGLQRLQDNIMFLRSVPLLQNLSNDVLAKIADVLEVEFYPAGAYIIRQGASGDTFFIISSGSVKITQRGPGRLEEDEIRRLDRGDYFGEQALLKEDCRTASVIALHPGVECLTLDRDSFIQLIGDLSEIKEKDYGDENRSLARPTSATNVCADQEYEYMRLDDLDVIATLGVGGFGRVELVQYSQNPSLTFALKCLKKQHIVDTQQQDHVFSERNIMMSCRSPFICRLYRTFRDSKYVYMLLEACLGGEVWTILRDRGCFDDHTTRFITACVIEAFDYLHARGIVYRDLKPENLLLDSQGYVKLVDFGFSKRLGYSSKTWTFCGTPEYVAPETILNKGHDRAVDYWALGILMHELLTGNPPFTASDPMKTYNLILKGIDMIDFAKHNVSRSAQSLIKKLCRDSPSERLGYQRGGIQDIKKHKWFQSWDWEGLRAKALPPPIAHQVRGPCDHSNFDCFGKDNDIPPDEFSNWDIEF